MSYADCISGIAAEMEKNEQMRDQSRLRKLFRKSHAERRQRISTNKDGVGKILETCPLLSYVKFVSTISSFVHNSM
jgi:hypothetical protein